MKKNRVFIAIFMSCIAQLMTASSPTSHAAQKTTSSLFTSSMSLHSINEQAIDKIYGASGLHLPDDDIAHIKKTYSYFESIAKAEKPTLSSITSHDIQTSTIWQLCLKAMIVDYYDNQRDYVESMSMVRDQMFPYLANIELNFYNNDFIKLRQFAELLRAKKIVQDSMLKLYFSQCLDWDDKDIAILETKIKAFKTTDFYLYTHNQNVWALDAKNGALHHFTTLNAQLKEQIFAFFMLTNIQSDVQNKFHQKNLLSFLHQASSLAIAPNFFFYQSTNFAALDDILTLQEQMNALPAAAGLTQTTFNINDLVDPSKVAADKTAQASTQTKKPALKEADNVVIQTNHPSKKDESVKKSNDKFVKNMKESDKVFDAGMKHIGDATAKDLKNISKDGNKWIVHAGKAAGLSIAGFGATMIGDIVYAQTGNASMKNWGAKANSQALKDIQAAGKDLDNIVKDTFSLLEDGIVAPIALVLGSAIGFITQDQKQGQDYVMMLNQVTDSLLNFASNIVVALNNTLVTNVGVQYVRLTDSATEVLVDACMVVFEGVTGQKGAANRSAALCSQTGKGLVKNCTLAVTQSLSSVIDSGMAVVMSTAMVMASIENALTTITFDLVREITFLGCGLAELMGANVNAVQEREAISAKMEAHRNTINVVMSVVVSIAMVVCTFGAAAPEIAAQEAAANAAVAATKEAAAIAAKQAAEKAAEEATTVATKEAAEKTVATATEKAAAATAEKEAADVTALTTKEAAAQAAKDSSFLALYGAEMLGQTINIVFSVFSLISGNAQDEASISKLSKEKESIEGLWQFVENNKVVMTQGQNFFLDELHKKHQVEIENQSFGLNYYTNYLNSSINNVQVQIAHALAGQYIQLLTPDSNGLSAADIGSSWGLKTSFNYLYPSQGFLTTTLGRSDFPYAQEVAQAPLVAQNKTPDATTALNSQPEPIKLWFNQRAVTTINQPTSKALDVEIKFRVIYNLTSDFYVGLYLGGTYYNYNSPDYLAQIQQKGIIDLDAAHGAKMFVLKRDSHEKTPSLAVYEHEGKGWLLKKPCDSSLFSNVSIYHMKAHLDKDQLIISFWPEDNPAKKWNSTVKVTPCDQRTFGVIFSGTAIEWNVIQPTMTITQNSSLRTALTNPSEADREHTAKAAWKLVKNPVFGSMKLSSCGKKYLIQGQYVYTTQSTKMTDASGKIMNDYVIFATTFAGSVSTMGLSPTPPDSSTSAPNAIVSLINGNVYNATGAIVATKQDPWTLYEKGNGPFDQAFINSIKKAQKAYPQKVIVAATPVIVTNNAAVSATTSPGTISISDVAIGAAPSCGGFEFGLSDQAPAASKSSAQSFEKRQSQAAGNATVQVGGFAGNQTQDASVGAAGLSL